MTALTPEARQRLRALLTEALTDDVLKRAWTECVDQDGDPTLFSAMRWELLEALQPVLAALDRRAEQPTREGFLAQCTERQKTCAHRLYGPKQMERCIQCVIDEALEQLTVADRRAEGETEVAELRLALEQVVNTARPSFRNTPFRDALEFAKSVLADEPAPPSGGQT